MAVAGIDMLANMPISTDQRAFIGTFELSLEDNRQLYVSDAGDNFLTAELEGTHSNKDEVRRRFHIYRIGNGMVEIDSAWKGNVYVTATSWVSTENKGTHTNVSSQRRQFFVEPIPGGFFELRLADFRYLYINLNGHWASAEPKGRHTNTEDRRRRFLMTRVA
eukprot:TRINITY_DN4004_c0_g1_i10.p1 TRINITY_DN4004_c0_g1~~TRINITY_DN4004_c0_g1_i10.p1  ORF type:complete len:179 (-),score=24.69 TRINITY_DN4004_c0_g1_i10:822-1310(-)